MTFTDPFGLWTISIGGTINVSLRFMTGAVGDAPTQAGANNTTGRVARPFAFFAKAGAVPLQSKTSLASRPKQNFNRSYTYNSLNHIQSMSAPGDGCSGLSWTIDAWGNRTARVAQPFAFLAKAGDVHSSHQIVVHWRNVSQCLGD